MPKQNTEIGPFCWDIDNLPEFNYNISKIRKKNMKKQPHIYHRDVRSALECSPAT